MILSLARSPAKKTTMTVFSHFSPVVGSSTVPRIRDCFKNMFPRVARNKIRSNEITLFVKMTPVMKPKRIAFAPEDVASAPDSPPPRAEPPARPASSSAISKYELDLAPIPHLLGVVIGHALMTIAVGKFPFSIIGSDLIHTLG